MDSKDKDAYTDTERRAAMDVSLVEQGSSSDDCRQRDSGPSDNSNVEKKLERPEFRLYKQRHVGVLGIIALNIVAGMNLTWFGPIANDTSDAFGITLDQVNWLANIVACTYVAVSPIVPLMCARYGLRISYAIGTCFLIISAWVRYAGTAHSLSSTSAYALLLIGQFLAAIPQVIFQVLAPKFSETWFDLKGRTTATMLMSVSNPVGTALGQLISPMINSVRSSVLVLGIISTVVTPFTLLVRARPPTPPSYSGSQQNHHFLTTIRAILGLLPPNHSSTSDKLAAESTANPGCEPILDSPVSKLSRADWSPEDRVGELRTYPPKEPMKSNTPRQGEVALAEGDSDVDAYMTMRERFDFVILALVFSVLVAGVNTFSILSNEILEPYGYSSNTAGLMGAALLLSGLLAAFLTAPLFDRVLTHHLGLSARITIPFIAFAWLSLIWAARPNNTGALYAIFVVIGVCSISMLPVALELGCELTRNSEASSAILWWSGNAASIVFTLVMSALRAPESADPPKNMHKSLIYCGVSVCSCALFILLLRGQQRRRERDARFAAAAEAIQSRSAKGNDEKTTRRWISLRMFKRNMKNDLMTS